eukprot:Partr_v1_DN28487_c0_g3_i2_m42057
MVETECSVCHNDQAKYKCPGCISPYCSIACFRRHKENDACKHISPSKCDPKTKANLEFTLDRRALAALASDQNLKQIISESTISSQLEALDACTDSKSKDAMYDRLLDTNANFKDMVDRIMSLV